MTVEALGTVVAVVACIALLGWLRSRLGGGT
jgi:hypothetical protein